MTSKRALDSDFIKRVAEILKTIGHPIRLHVLEALEEYDTLSVSELLDEMDGAIEQSLLSHHLIKMKDRGILKSTKEGMNVYYSLTDRKILKIFDCMDNCSLI